MRIPIPYKKYGPEGIRTRDFFCAIDKQVGEKRKKAVYYVYFVRKSPYCFSISVTELFPQYEARKGDPQPCPEGEKRSVNRFQKLVLIGAVRTHN
jgi:hypothetical protein